MQRPLGVTMIAVLQFLLTALMILVSLALGTGLLGRTFSLNPAEPVSRFLLLASTAKMGAICSFLFTCFLAALGHGMWNLRNWARIATIIVEAAGVVGASFGLLWAITHLELSALLVTSIRLGISILILWYLNQPHVVRAFGIVQTNSAGIPG